MRFATTFVVLALVAPAAGTFDSARTCLATAIHLSTAEISRVDRGSVVSRTLEVSNRREVAALGVVRIKTSPQRYIERLTDIAKFKRTDDVLQIGTFSDAPQPADLAALTIDDADLKLLRACRVEDCEINLVPQIRAPKLIVQGRYDEDSRLKTQAEPLHKLLRDLKRILLYDGGHVPTLELIVPVINSWLDETLGRVKTR